MLIALGSTSVLQYYSSPGPQNEDFQKIKKITQVIIQSTCMSNFNIIGPFLTSPGCAEGFGLKWFQATKMKIEKIENSTPGTQETSVPNFSQIQPYLGSV